jgi:DNA-binding CsgD family transcriptional regulator/PAS domain-containing protein
VGLRVEDGSFLDLLYGAAVEPHLWVSALERLADLTGGNSAWLSRLSLENGRGSAVTARIDPEFPERYLAYYADINPFAKVANPRSFMSGFELKVTTDDMWMPKDQLTGLEYYNDFLTPQDVHSFAAVRLAARGLDICAVTINRSAKKGGFSTDDMDLARRLQPHMIRAFELTEKLTVAGLMTDGMAAALDQTPFGVFLLDDTGRLQRANRTAERLLSGLGGVCLLHGRLTASQPDAARKLHALIATATSPDRSLRSGGAMTLRISADRAPLSVTVAPIRSERLPVFDHRPSVVVCITDPEAEQAISAQQVLGLYGLTAAEARVAAGLMSGVSSRDIATSNGVSIHTVRHQLQSMLEKTGASRQSELVAMLMRAVVPQLN